MSRKWSTTSGLLAAVAAVSLAGAGTASADNPPNPHECKQVSACGTGNQPAPAGDYTVWCDWNGQVPDYILEFDSGTVTRTNVINGSDNGTIACGHHVGVSSSIHMEVYFKAWAVDVWVGWHR